MRRDYSLIGEESQRAMELGLADAEWYQTPIPRDKMRELLTRKNGPAIKDTMLWFGIIIGSGYLVFIWWGTWMAILPYILYSVLYASTSDSRWHESSHGTAFRSDWMNNLLYEISSFMVLRQSTVWKWSHARHHSDTIIRGRDPEIAVPRPPQLRKIFLTFLGIAPAIAEWKKIMKHAAGKIDPEVATYVPDSEYKKVFMKARIYISIYLVVIALSIFYSTILPLMLIGLPTLFGSWLMPVYGLTQHAGLNENVLDHRLNSRTVYMNRIHRFLYWNMNYHVEHHMFPLVPYHALPKLHELMKDDCPKPYNGIIDAFKEIIPAILKQRKDPTYFVERKLPQKSQTGNLQSNKITGNSDTLKDGTIEVCPLEKLAKADVLRFDFLQNTYAVYRSIDDKFYATDGMCTHGNAHLGDGIVIGETIECAKHNGRFHLKDGLPARDPVCVGISTYEAFAKEGKIYINLEKGNRNKIEEEFSYRVLSNENLTPFIKELVIEPSEDQIIKYQPGQYVQFVIPPHETKFTQFEISASCKSKWESMNLFNCFADNNLQLKRNYSIATNPKTERQLKFNVRIALPPLGENVPAGSGSSYMFGLKQGDEVKLYGPYGDFQIKSTEAEMVYIGGGAGMAPIKSHLSHLLESIKSKRKITFWYGARSRSDIFYEKYFEKLKLENKNFEVHIALSEPKMEDNWKGYTGFIHEVFTREYLLKHQNPAKSEYYLCGPLEMIKACRKTLEEYNVPKNHLTFDEF